jgi:hypothetical protein
VLDFSYKEIAEILGINENVVKARLNRARASLTEFFSRRCQWLCEDSTCSCKSRIGFALALDTEILKRVKQQVIEAGVSGEADANIIYKTSIDELYKKFPTVEYWGRNILKEKLG